MAPSFKVELARFSAWLRIQDGVRVWQQAGAELGQAQDKLKVKVDVGVEVQVKVGAEVEV